MAFHLLIFLYFLSFSGKLIKYELPAAVTLCKEVWSPDMGLVTAAFKLKRKDIQERYQHDINRMYASWNLPKRYWKPEQKEKKKKKNEKVIKAGGWGKKFNFPKRKWDSFIFSTINVGNFHEIL